jgi:hypothetical protein
MSWSRSPARWRDDAAAAATPPRRASSSAAHQTRSAARLEPSTPATRHVAHWGRGGVGVGSSPLRDATNEDAAAASSPSPPPPPPPFAFKTTTYAPTPWTPPTPRDDVDDDAASDAISTLRRDAERARTLRNELRVLAVGASSSFSSSDATSRLAAALLAKGDELARVCDGVVAASARVATTNARDRVDRSTDGDAAEARARRLELELLDAKDALVARRRECVRLRVLAEEATAARDAASSGATRTREEKEKRSLAVGYAMARAKRRVELGRRFRAWSSWASRSLARRWCDARETRARATAKAFAGWRGRVVGSPPFDRERAAAVVRAAAVATWRAAATRSSRELRETLDAVRASAATDVERAMERAAAAEGSSVASLEKTRDVQDALEAFERHAAARDDAKTRELDAVRAQKADAREEIARLERRLSEHASEAAVRSYSIHWSQTTASAW